MREGSKSRTASVRITASLREANGTGESLLNLEDREPFCFGFEFVGSGKADPFMNAVGSYEGNIKIQFTELLQSGPLVKPSCKVNICAAHSFD